MWPVPIKIPPGLLCVVADDFRYDRQWLACSHHPWKLLEGVEVEGATFDVAVKGGQVLSELPLHRSDSLIFLYFLHVLVENLLKTISYKKP